MHNKYAIVFPGQGSQAVGMLKELANEYPQVQTTFEAASEVLSYDLWELVQQGPAEQLNQTEFTQPALLAAGVAVWKIWTTKNNVPPVFLAGHSLGEYTALVCAEVLNFSDAIKLVRERGRFMQHAYAGAGAMVAIVGLTDETIPKICHDAAQGEVLMVANYNSIGQTVLAGQLAAIERAAEQAKNLGAKLAKILPVSVPSHCALMQPAAAQLATVLAAIPLNVPKIPVIHNAAVACYREASQIKEALISQLYSPVRWVETIQFMVKSGVKHILECGPGKVLTGLNKRIDHEISADFLGEPQQLQNCLG